MNDRPELNYEQLGRAFGISWQRVYQLLKAHVTLGPSSEGGRT